MRESWTDERMDDLKEQVIEQGRRVDGRFASLESRFDSFEVRMESLRVEMNACFDAGHRTTVQLFAVTMTTLAGLISAQTALLLALL